MIRGNNSLSIVSDLEPGSHATLEPAAELQLPAEAISYPAAVPVLSPGTEGHHDRSGVVLGAEVHRLVRHKAGRFHRRVAAVNGVDYLLVRHGAVDAIRRQDREGILAMLHLATDGERG
ncbi:unnamed protein product [Ixodes pacificus]